MLKWIYAHVFLFAFTIGLGCAVGYISPLLAAAEGYDDRAIDELLISGREDQPFRRTAFGGTLGGLAALALAIHTRRR
ncbi:MAG: hypothetical protein KDD82_19615 [Planctomycetes bacterium]|nr:hypothetical protein [Planctomycetota bacterium]